MTTTIDHVAESNSIMDSVHDWQGEEGSTDATLTAAALDALRHATLALVEQQSRTADAAEVANLIAWKQLHTPREVDERGLFNDLPVIRDDLTNEIETAMGLGL